MTANPFGDERRLFPVLDLDDGAPDELHAVALDLLELRQREARAHARPARHRRREPHAVQAVVDAHAPLAVRKGHLREMREKREREEAVRDGAAEGRALRPLAIDVDPLEVVDRLGEGVDALLRHLEPRRDGDFLADAALEFADGERLAHLRNLCSARSSSRARRSLPAGSSLSSSLVRPWKATNSSRELSGVSFCSVSRQRISSPSAASCCAGSGAGVRAPGTLEGMRSTSGPLPESYQGGGVLENLTEPVCGSTQR